MKWNGTLGKGFVSIISVLMIITAAGVFAQRHDPDGVPPRHGNFIERFDKDADGKVSKDEFDRPAEHFKHMNQNRSLLEK